ncbi:MAG: hypothetical protein A2234_06560 [Elusimicrobia bacterium RIFOXYA2_FULL_58_8]|nr:MAG: hypothetical protein A2234_06560 [Elusimicrobia bacterium RIFOXYA2_FULL_58_8]
MKLKKEKPDIAGRKIELGKMLSYQYLHTPRRMLYLISYFEFAARLIGERKSVLDAGCGEGLGTWLLALECGRARGIDSNAELVDTAQRNWTARNVSFECADLLKARLSGWDAVVSFDVIEHIYPRNAPLFFKQIKVALTDTGMAIIGTPNLTANKYASKVAKAGHVNLHSGETLETEMKRHFRNVFVFAANDEVIHTGYLPMAHYLIAVGCGKKG